jgi:hypothetical protein
MDFRFSLDCAHALAASTCMKMIYSPRSLEMYLEQFSTLERSFDLTPFLDYAVEHWSYHLRASGIRLDKDNDMIDTTRGIIKHNLDMSLLVMGALADVFQRINTGKVKQMMQAIAIRDTQSALLPTIRAVEKLIPCLQDLVNGLRKINIELTERGQLRAGTWKTAGIDREEEESPSAGSLDSELDSKLMLEVFSLVESDPKLFVPIKGQLDVLRHASRKLRGLTIRLTVDPIRTWLYHQTGDHGLNPIPALAQATHSLDVLHESALTAPPKSDRSDFREQFSAESSHPLHGLIVSTRHELEEKGRNILTEAFYKEHILDHYRLHKLEWKAVEFTTFILEYTSGYNNFILDTMVRRWHAQSVKVMYDEDADAHQPSSILFARTKPRTSEDTTGWIEFLWYILKIAIVVIAKLLTLISPAIEQLFIDFYNLVAFKGRMIYPWIEYLFTEWRHVSVALLVYLLRLQYFPWLFASSQNTP